MAEQTIDMNDPIFAEAPAPAPAKRAAKAAPAPAPAPVVEAPVLSPIEEARAEFQAAAQAQREVNELKAAVDKRFAEASARLAHLEAGAQPSLQECNRHYFAMNGDSEAQRAQTLAALKTLGLAPASSGPRKPHPLVGA